ncbi:MAG: hypothetical protein IJB59_07650 [Oscillospiraceae bacterium]|nr:hypothetical protein [Oscillospiraceae bacterium]
MEVYDYEDDEEPDQVHGRLRRNAEQDRLLIKKNFHTLNFGGKNSMSMKKNLIRGMQEIGEMRSIFGE